MIAYIKGPLVEKEEDVIVVEAGAVGYNIHVPLSFLEQLPPIGTEVCVYTYLQLREDAVTLFGFGSREDVRMFKQLIGVNGIGPKGALGLLSALRPDALRLAILSGDVKAISKAPGIGSKTAQRVILDLKDRVSVEEVLPRTEKPGGLSGESGGMAAAAREAVEALVALGYSAVEAARAVHQVEGAEKLTAEAILKASLKHL